MPNFRPLSRIPTGFLNFFNIQTGGRFISEMSDVIQPTYDLQRHYLESYPTVITQVVAVNAMGLNTGFTQLTVPESEAWHVLGISANTDQLAAGQRFSGAIIRWNNGLQGTPFVNEFLSDEGNWSNVAPVTLSLNPVLMWKPAPLVLIPGDQVSLYISNLVGGPLNCRVTVRFARFR